MHRTTAVLTAAFTAWMIAVSVAFLVAYDRLHPAEEPPAWLFNFGYEPWAHEGHWDVWTDSGADHCMVVRFEIRCEDYPIDDEPVTDPAPVARQS